MRSAGNALRFPLSLSLSPMYQVEKFCGASNGWRPVGRPRSHSKASELRRKVEAIRPDFISRVRCVSPELFPL